MKKVLTLTKANFESSNLDTDFKKSRYIDLLIEAEEYDLAENISKDFDELNEFNLQKLSKIYRGQGKYSEAIRTANEAINFKKGIKSEYVAAFLNDRAEAENRADMEGCLNTLSEGISKQTNEKTKTQWEAKLNEWKLKYNKDTV